MATITVPTFTAGTTTDAGGYTQALYSPTVNSLEYVNGNLDMTNVPAATRVSKEMIQRGALSGSGGVSGTANLDYFRDWWINVANSTLGESGAGVLPSNDGDQCKSTSNPSNRDYYIPIPGASVQFHCPYTSDAVFTWSIMWGHDATSNVANTYIRLFVDGSPVNEQVRMAGQTFYSSPSLPLMLQRGRYWHGHHAVEGLAAGHHSVSLRIFMDPTGSVINQCRVWSRSMRYFYFMQPG